jgi:hypothetical protein
MRPERLSKGNDPIGNLTSDPPTGCALSQPTAPQHSIIINDAELNIYTEQVSAAVKPCNCILAVSISNLVRVFGIFDWGFT